MKKFKAIQVSTGKIMSEWTSDFSDENHYEENWGKPEHQVEVTPRQVIYHEEIPAVIENEVEVSASIPAWTEVIEATYETVPSEYTIEIEDITLQVEKQNRIAQKIAIGQITDKACNDVFMLIQGYNVERQLTSEQKTEMTNLFLPALQAIQVRRPSQLKQYISSITPDGILVTDEMKSDILELLSNF